MYFKAFIVSHSTWMLRLQTFAKNYGANDLLRFGVTLVLTYSEVLGSGKSFLIHFHRPSPIVSLSMNTSLELLYKFSSYSIWALSLTNAPEWHHFLGCFCFRYGLRLSCPLTHITLSFEVSSFLSQPERKSMVSACRQL